jgi:HKD family nuclease
MSLFPDSTAVVMNLPQSFVLQDELRSARTIRLATAFAKMTGWQLLSDSIRESRATKYFLAGSSFFLTQPEVLFCWLTLCKQDNVHAALHSESSTTFHPKVLIVEGESPFAIIGSGNLSRGGLKDNIECGLYTDDEFIVRELCRWFDDLFTHCPALTEGTVLDYKRKWAQLRKAAQQLRKEQEQVEKEFRENRKATLARWNDAVKAAKSYLSSEEYPKSYKARLDAAKLIKGAIHYPRFDFDVKEWRSFYGVPEMGHLIPIWRDRIFKKKQRLQTGFRGLIAGDVGAHLNELLLPSGRYHIQGLGLNAITKVLAVHAPTQWTVYNKPVEKTLRSFGYVSPRGGTPADKYFAFTKMMDKFKEETGAEDAFALDSFFAHYYFGNLKKSSDAEKALRASGKAS